MTGQAIHLSFPLKEIFDVIPDIASSIIRYSPRAAELSDTFQGSEVTFTFELGDQEYTLAIRNGREFITGNDNGRKSMVKVIMALEDLENMITVNTARMVLGWDLSRAGEAATRKTQQLYDRFSNVRGSILTVLKGNDGHHRMVTFVFNGIPHPKAVIHLSMETLEGLISGKENPVNLFMSGRLQIEGDMALAMNLQTLF
jgi:hypothetical protein